ncbi:MAG: ABC transporter ATP-binding protein [Patescibacteria group bacterium]
MEPIIKAENIKVIYNRGKAYEFTALNGIDIEVFPEEYLIFYGPSGCGKSTMLYTILGLQTPSDGKLYINGEDSSTFNEAQKSKMDSQYFGIVFQNFNLIYSLNVLENITLPQVFINSPKKEREDKAMILLKRFGIETRSKDIPSNLSGGQQQRVAICRALVNDPAVLLADEPVGNLDSESAKIVMETLKDINRRDRKTVILVTHDPSYLPYADRIYFFKDAKIERVVKNRRTVEDEDKTGEEFTLTNQLAKLARVHDYMNVPQLKAWSLTNYLIEEMTVNQTERLEKAMEFLLSGKLSEHGFFEELNRSYGEGGVGLYITTAINYTMKVSELLREVSECLKVVKNNTNDGKMKMVEILRKFLLSDYKGHLTPEQIQTLEKVIHNRVFGISSVQEFNKFLDWPVEEGGVGLNVATAEHLAEKLEIILGQMYSV